VGFSIETVFVPLALRACVEVQVVESTFRCPTKQKNKSEKLSQVDICRGKNVGAKIKKSEKSEPFPQLSIDI
jgi:hypothetical protein